MLTWKVVYRRANYRRGRDLPLNAGFAGNAGLVPAPFRIASPRTHGLMKRSNSCRERDIEIPQTPQTPQRSGTYLLQRGFVTVHYVTTIRILGISNSTSRWTGCPTACAFTWAAIKAPATAGQ